MPGDVRLFRFRQFEETANADWDYDAAKDLDDKPGSLDIVELDHPCVGPYHVHKGIVNRIHIHLTSTNAVTYQFAFYGCRDGAAASMQLESDKIFDSTWQVGGSPDPLQPNTEYIWDCLCIPFCLCYLSRIYHNIVWSAATGPVTGYIEVAGRRVAYEGQK